MSKFLCRICHQEFDRIEQYHKHQMNTHIDPGHPAHSVARDPLLVEREKTHGSFEHNAEIYNKLWYAASVTDLEKLTKSQHLALSMIFVKIARVLSNPKTKDSWDDIAGYAKLGAEACND